MFQPTTECIDSLAIDDIAGQTVPEFGVCNFLLDINCHFGRIYNRFGDIDA